MSTGRCALLILVAACSSKKAAEAPPATCLPGEISSTKSAIAATDQLTAWACWGERCLSFDHEGKATGDVPAGVVKSEQRKQRAATTTTIGVTATGEPQACNASLCAILPWRSPMTSLAAASQSLKRVTTYGINSITVWDVKTGTLVTQTPLTVPGTASEALHVGDTHVMFRTQTGPWTLVDLVSGATLPIGAAGSQLTVLDEATAAVYDRNQLVVVDVQRMAAGSPFQMPGTISAVLPWDFGGRVFVVLERPAATAQIDPKTGTYYAGPPIPLCK